mmetsp:Transcript_36404/g.93886  ORF Transcript_36404/g.93886 Transcript_36404/m.93886 type:complete len:225 (+) Transcript_36404:1042-1716(+)
MHEGKRKKTYSKFPCRPSSGVRSGTSSESMTTTNGTKRICAKGIMSGFISLLIDSLISLVKLPHWKVYLVALRTNDRQRVDATCAMPLLSCVSVVLCSTTCGLPCSASSRLLIQRYTPPRICLGTMTCTVPRSLRTKTTPESWSHSASASAELWRVPAEPITHLQELCSKRAAAASAVPCLEKITPPSFGCPRARMSLWSMGHLSESVCSANSHKAWVTRSCCR